jgi:phage protein D
MSAGFENQTVMQIAATVADRHGLSVVGQPGAANPIYARMTQRQESDLAFLQRIAAAHGYEFTVRGSQLIFYSRASLEAQPPVMTLGRTDVERFCLSNPTRNIFRAAQVTYQNPTTRELIFQSTADPAIPTGDTLRLTQRCENGQQAALRAQAELAAANRRFFNIRLSTPGATALSAGNTIELTGFGQFDTTYLIETARHRLNCAGGYTTEIEACHVQS